MSSPPQQCGIGMLMLAAAIFGGSLPPQQTGAPQPATATAPTEAGTPLDGHALFQEKGCAHCHGPNASGTDRAPSLASIGRRLSRAKMEQQIHDGGATMPAFGAVLSEPETQSLLDYLTSRKAPTKHTPKGAAQ